MTGIVVLAAVLLAVAAALEVSHRRHRTSPSPTRPAGDDRDLARTKLDLLALGAAAQPLTHKPITVRPAARPACGNTTSRPAV